MGTFLDSIRDQEAKRAAARQYVLAAERFREMARAKRRAGRDGAERREQLAETLIRNAGYEVTA